MEESQLRQKYREIEDRIVPIVDFLEINRFSGVYKDTYKGIITLQSPLIFNPEILFIGINGGPGAFEMLNYKSSKINTPLRMIGKSEIHFKELSWYESGNARKSKEGKEYEWYQRNKRVNNTFAKNMIDLLFEIAKRKFPEEYKKNKYNDSEFPFWYEDFGKSIMCTNLYPIATTNVSDLKKIHTSLADEKDLHKFWEESRGKDKYIKEWVVRKYFLKRIDELIYLVQPKVIVFMGISAFNDFMDFKNFEGRDQRLVNRKDPIQSSILTFDNHKIPVVGFRRDRGWSSSSRISEIAEKIVINK